MEPLSEPTTQPVAGGDATEAEAAAPVAEQPLVLEDVLVEDVSIDGMCGVY